MFSATSSGSFDNMEAFLKKAASGSMFDTLERFGDEGVRALAAATPKDSGESAGSWYYEIIKDSKSWSIVWGNTHVVDGTPVVVLLEHGHGTGTGGYVPPHPFINDALKGVFDRIATEAWKVVTA
jgi:hypothetical protein